MTYPPCRYGKSLRAVEFISFDGHQLVCKQHSRSLPAFPIIMAVNLVDRAAVIWSGTGYAAMSDLTRAEHPHCSSSLEPHCWISKQHPRPANVSIGNRRFRSGRSVSQRHTVAGRKQQLI
jgi:hypothetical protein